MKTAQRFKGVSFAGLAVAFTIYGATAQAQETDGAAGVAEAAQPEDNDGIVVTGTRLRSGLAAPTPVTVTTASELEALSPNLIAESVNVLPVFRNSSRPQSTTQSPTQENGASFLNLRGIGKERTLVLLDGRRSAASSTAGVPDVNLFPQDLIERVDVVTGGASAAYGSDAVAGVVNFVLDRDFEGLRLRTDAGVSQHGDGEIAHISLSGGASFAEGRGHIIGNLDYFQQDGIGRFSGRAPLEQFYGIAPTGQPSPSQFVTPDWVFTIAPGGLINSGPLAGMQFMPDGSLTPFDFGTNRTALNQIGGDGLSLPFDLLPSTERYSGFVHAEYEIGRATLYGEVLLSEVTPSYNWIWNQQGVGPTHYTIFADNAFLPQSVRDAMTEAGVESFQLRRMGRDWGYQSVENRRELQRYVAGVDWRFGDDWALNAYLMYGDSDQTNTIGNTTNSRNLYAAADAVLDPETNTIVCRSTLAGYDPGCVPLNLFGEGAASPEAVDFITGDSISNLSLQQTVASASVSGPLIDLPAGPVNVAIGLEYREESAESTIDAITASIVSAEGLRGMPPSRITGIPGGFAFNNALPLSGSYDVTEWFGEAEAPLFSDAPFANFLSVNGAVRVISYSTVGTVTTWKAGFVYDPVADIRLRATRSRDIRAGNIQELFTGLERTVPVVNYQGVSESAQQLRSGNLDLDPEVADTFTIGAIYRPSWAPGLGISLDYYSIKIDDAISQLTAQQTIDRCASGSSVACAQISREPGGQLVITTPTLNLASVETNGVDLEIDYSMDVGEGHLRLRALMSYLDELVTSVAGAPPVDTAGDIGIEGKPHFTGSFLVNYARGPLDLYVNERVVGSGRLNVLVPDSALAENHLDPVFYTDVAVNYDFTPNVRGFLSINNVFGQGAVVAPGAPFGSFRPTNAAVYDVMGRYLTVGLRFNY